MLISNLLPYKNLKQLILETVLILSCLIVLITETLSAFHLLNYYSIIITWFLILLIVIFNLFKYKSKTIESFHKIKTSILNYYQASTSLLAKFLIFFIFLGLLFILFQGIIYPPNNWDSLTYHMTRIMYWLGNESVMHFPSNVLRNLYQPPFAEYFIMNVNVVNGNDYLSNSIQLLFLTISIIASWSVLDFFNVNTLKKIIVAFLIITIPAVEMQASTAKNDIVCGFFVLCSLFYCIKSYFDCKMRDFIFLALTIGLGMFTKGTFYIYFLPILLVYIIFIIKKMIIEKKYKIVYFAPLVFIIVLLINVGHFSRNYAINGNVLTIDEIESAGYSNKNLKLTMIASNLMKNIGLHIDAPFQKNYDLWIRIFHKNNNININNLDSNYNNNPYSGPKELETHEDGIPNGIHFYIICFVFFVFSIFCVFSFKKVKKEFLLVFIICMQTFIFITYLKWQPWHTRLHIPIFMLSMVTITAILNKLNFIKIIYILILPIIIYKFTFNLLYNNLRPIITNKEYTKNVKMEDNRFKKYFANQPNLYKDYSSVLNLIYKYNPKKVGLILADWEYPLFHYFYKEKINLVSLNVNNPSSKISQNIDGVQCVIGDFDTQASIEINNKIYYNITPQNTNISFYKLISK